MKLIWHVLKFVCVQGAHGPLTVKWADVELGAKKRKAMEESQDPNRENCQVGCSNLSHCLDTCDLP